MGKFWRNVYWTLGLDYPEHWCERQRWFKYVICQEIEKGVNKPSSKKKKTLKTLKKRRKRKGKGKVSL